MCSSFRTVCPTEHVHKVCVQIYKPCVGVQQCWHPLPLPSVTLGSKVRVTLLSEGLLTELPKEVGKQRTDHGMVWKIRIEILAELQLISVGTGFFSSPLTPFLWSTKTLMNFYGLCMLALSEQGESEYFFFLISFFKCNSLQTKNNYLPTPPPAVCSSCPLPNGWAKRVIY